MVEIDPVKYWLNELANRAPSTKARYATFFDRFASWLGKTPHEIIKERKADFKGEDPRLQHKMESNLKAFIMHLRDSGYSTATQQVAYASVKSFFETNYLPLQMRGGDYPSGESPGKRAATKDDIRKMLKRSSAQGRALILALKDSGLRVSDMMKMTYGNVKEALESEQQFLMLKLVTQKNKVFTRTCLGPESLNALREYFKRRAKGTRRLPPEVIVESSPLFRTRDRKVVPVSRTGLSSILSFYVKRAGLKEISAHSLRKYFQTQLESGGVHPNWINIMIGHALPNAVGAYSKPTDEMLQGAYQKAYDALKVFEEVTVSDLEEELEKERAKRRELEERLRQIEENSLSLKTILEPLIAKETAPNNNFDYKTISSSDEAQLINLLQEGFEIYEKINDKVILRKLKR